MPNPPAKTRYGLLAATSVIVANMIGTGVFTSLGFQLVDLRAGFPILLLWALGGLAAFAGAMCYAELGAALPWTLRRANLLVARISLRPLAGSRIVIGEVILEVTGAADPCRRMDEAHAGLRRALTPSGRGGVRCRILVGGRIAVGDAAVWEPAMADLFEAPDTRRAAG